jgi:hypothetical protein
MRTFLCRSRARLCDSLLQQSQACAELCEFQPSPDRRPNVRCTFAWRWIGMALPKASRVETGSRKIPQAEYSRQAIGLVGGRRDLAAHLRLPRHKKRPFSIRPIFSRSNSFSTLRSATTDFRRRLSSFSGSVSRALSAESTGCRQLRRFERPSRTVLESILVHSWFTVHDFVVPTLREDQLTVLLNMATALRSDFAHDHEDSSESTSGRWREGVVGAIHLRCC